MRQYVRGCFWKYKEISAYNILQALLLQIWEQCEIIWLKIQGGVPRGTFLALT